MPLLSISDGTIRIKCDLSIINVAALKPQLLELLDKGRPIQLDLSEVTEMDSAGFQLLWLLSQEASANQSEFIITAHSKATLKLIKLYRAGQKLVRAKN